MKSARRPVSRVLSANSLDRIKRIRGTTIPLGRALQRASRDQPGRRDGNVPGSRVLRLTRPPRAPKVRNIVALPAQLPNDSVGDRGRLVGAVVEKLEMQLFSRPIERGHGSQTIRDHRGFVKNRDLHENMGKIGFANHQCRKRLAQQPAGRLLKNINGDENKKAAADKHKPAHGDEQAGFAPNSEKIKGNQ